MVVRNRGRFVETIGIVSIAEAAPDLDGLHHLTANISITARGGVAIPIQPNHTFISLRPCAIVEIHVVC